MGKQRSLRSKAVHFVSDLTTVLLNPISDKPSKPSPSPSPPPPPPPPPLVSFSIALSDFVNIENFLFLLFFVGLIG